MRSNKAARVRRAVVSIAAVMGFGVLVAFGQDRESPSSSTATIERLFAAEQGDALRGDREAEMRELVGEYSRVRDAVLLVLRSEDSQRAEEIVFRSRLYYAIRLAMVWRISEARSDLTTLSPLRLRPESVPPGIRMSGASFYPAAEALASIPGSPMTLVRAMTDENSPFVVWAMAEGYGRTASLALLKDFRATTGADGRLLESAISSIERVERITDLLPPMPKPR